MTAITTSEQMLTKAEKKHCEAVTKRIEALHAQLFGTPYGAKTWFARGMGVDGQHVIKYLNGRYRVPPDAERVVELLESLLQHAPDAIPSRWRSYRGKSDDDSQ